MRQCSGVTLVHRDDVVLEYQSVPIYYRPYKFTTGRPTNCTMDNYVRHTKIQNKRSKIYKVLILCKN